MRADTIAPPSIRLHHDLDAMLPVVTKLLISFGSLVEIDAVRDHETRIDIPALNTLQKPLHVTRSVRLPHFESQTFGERRADRKLIDHSGVYPGNRDRAARPAGLDRLAQCMRTVGFQPQRLFGSIIQRIGGLAMGLHPHSIDAGIRSAASGHFFELLYRVNV